MNSNFKYLVGFGLGLSVGVTISWKYMEKKFRQIADEEIESVKEVFSIKPVIENKEEQHVAEPDEKIEEPRSGVNEYEKVLEKTGYNTDYSEISKGGESSMGNNIKNEPYIIEPNELGELGYDVIELLFYEGDSMLTDEYDEPIDDVGDTVGWDSLDRFGEYGEDTVCVRNDIRKVDYEIMLDVRSFSEMMELRKYEE